jgi:hypothetical protein
MIAGTIVVLGQAGLAGYLMRRGPSLADAGQPWHLQRQQRARALAIHLLLESLASYGPGFRRFARQRRFRRWVGDLGAGGQGEILLPAA